MQFDSWCERRIRPWFDDHRIGDTERIRRWSGGDIDLTRSLPSDLVVAAADADPGLNDVVGPYNTMDALPASLAAVEPRARAIYTAGWRPRVPDGPTHDELVELCSDDRRPDPGLAAIGRYRYSLPEHAPEWGSVNCHV
jgi:hypothetical protein